jgi:hypothetical protein
VDKVSNFGVFSLVDSYMNCRADLLTNTFRIHAKFHVSSLNGSKIIAKIERDREQSHKPFFERAKNEAA